MHPLSCVALLLVLMLSGCQKIPERYTTYSFDYFDTATTIVGYADSKEEFDSVCTDIKEQLAEYHRLYTIYNRYEGLNNLYTINETVNGVHQAVRVDQRIIDLLLYAKEMYTLTGGKVNVAMGSVLSIWHDYRTAGLNDHANAQLPPMKQLQAAAGHTDIENLQIDEEAGTVFLADPEMTLDVGAIAKGYAAERVGLYLEEQGITGYILNLGGNVRTVGARPDGTPWTAGIENPDTDDTEKPHIAYLQLSGESLVTSGSYQRYYTVDGKGYHHIIDQETLMPGENYRSVSVVCKDSGQGDALSTALFTMNYEEGSALVESLAEVEAMWVLPDGTQRYSSGFESYALK